jgi:hypothetical protein
LFIDLDAKGLKSDEFVDDFVRPSISYYCPCKCPEALENFEEFTSYVNEPSKTFLQFAERHLSLNKADPSNNPGFKSCPLRVTY